MGVIKDYNNTGILLTNYFKAIKALKEAGITSNKKDFTSQIGEWLVSEIYDGKKAVSPIQKDWDIEINGKHIQVKTHSKAISNLNRWSAIKYNERADVDELIIVVFTEEYNLKEFYKVDWIDALKLIRPNKGRDIINWNQLTKYKIELNDLPNQSLIDLFRISPIL